MNNNSTAGVASTDSCVGASSRLLLNATLRASTPTQGYLRKLQHSFGTSSPCLLVLNRKYRAIVQVIHKYVDERGLQQLV